MPQIKPHLKDLYRIKFGEKTRKNSLRLDMNEGVIGLPKGLIKEVLSKADNDLISAYPEYCILEKKIARHNNLGLKNICLANGSDAAIKYIFDAYVSEGDRILFTDPTFAMYPIYCSMFNAVPVAIEYNTDLSFPMKKFYDSITGDIEMAIIVNPNNPTGSVLSRGELIKIIKRAHKYNVILLVDEAYFYFYPLSVIKEVRKFDNLIVLRTFSKFCGMAGLRLGYVGASARIIEDLRRVKPTFDVSSFSVLIGEKFMDAPGIINSLVKSYNRGKDYLIGKLYREGIEYRDGHANFVLIKCKDKVGEIVLALARRNILVNGNFRQSFLKDYLRVTLADKPAMEKFWNNFIAIFRRAHAKNK